MIWRFEADSEGRHDEVSPAPRLGTVQAAGQNMRNMKEPLRLDYQCIGYQDQKRRETLRYLRAGEWRRWMAAVGVTLFAFAIALIALFILALADLRFSSPPK
jgi:hypothetical protein